MRQMSWNVTLRTHLTMFRLSSCVMDFMRTISGCRVQSRRRRRSNYEPKILSENRIGWSKFCSKKKKNLLVHLLINCQHSLEVFCKLDISRLKGSSQSLWDASSRVTQFETKTSHRLKWRGKDLKRCVQARETKSNAAALVPWKIQTPNHEKDVIPGISLGGIHLDVPQYHWRHIWGRKTSM